jgi:anti-sigma-K factor RskA
MVMQDHVLELIPAYALDCLDEPDAQVVAEHLEACTSCRAEFEAYRGIAAELPLAAPEAAPPAGLKAELFRQIAARAEPIPAPRPLTFWQRLSASLSRVLRPGWGLASLAVILVLGASNVIMWQRVNELEQVRRDWIQVSLHGTEAAPDASGLLVLNRDGTRGTLVVENLPDLDKAHQYQLWLIKDGQRISGGVFSVRWNGYGSLWVDSPEPLNHYTAFGITIEPAGGSPGPTGAKVLGGDF